MAGTFNFYEALFWFLIGIILLATALLDKSKRAYRTNLIISSFLFLVFGVSDLIEIKTGAWWRPIGLLLMKAGCIVGFLYCFAQYSKIKKSQSQ